jgi:hypothetical protein
MAVQTFDGGQFKNMTATGNVTSTDTWEGQLIGFYCNSTSAGTLVLRSGGSGGTVMCGTITPDKGFHRYPSLFAYPLHVTIGGTIDLTFFYSTCT